LLEHMRRIPLLAHLPVLICSALGSSDIVFRAAHLNIVSHIHLHNDQLASRRHGARSFCPVI
jgi:hypothetical protein